MRRFGFIVCLGGILLFARSSASGDLFSDCRFHFGTPANNVTNNAALMAQVDYLTTWAGYSENYSLGSFFQTCAGNGKTPVLMAYIIAYTARRDWSLQDCNVDSVNNLCKRGADYIRQQRPRILAQYAKYAKGAAGSFGTIKPIVWCMEPDYVQYADASQTNGGLTNAECGSLMSEILDSIKSNCPNAIFSMDISPWNDTTWQKKWFAALPMPRFTFINTSDGTSRPDQIYILPGWTKALPTWAWVSNTYNKPIIADAGYGVAGSSTGHDTLWDKPANLTARINDGCMAVSQANPNAGWATTIAGLRPQLPTPPRCPTGVKYAGRSDRRETGPAPLCSKGRNTLRYTLFEDTAVRIRIFSVRGALIGCMVNERQSAGVHSFAIDPRRFSNGSYLVELETGGSKIFRNMIIAK